VVDPMVVSAQGHKIPDSSPICPLPKTRQTRGEAGIRERCVRTCTSHRSSRLQDTRGATPAPRHAASVVAACAPGPGAAGALRCVHPPGSRSALIIEGGHLEDSPERR